MKPFKPETYTDFTKPANRKIMEKTLAKIESEFGREYSIIIGGDFAFPRISKDGIGATPGQKEGKTNKIRQFSTHGNPPYSGNYRK